MDLQFFSKSDLGQKYQHNEDYCVVPNDNNNNLFILCDGMGGRNAGEVASKLTATWLYKDFNELDKSFLDKFFKKKYISKVSHLIMKINKKILKLSKNHTQYDGMGTTIISALFNKNNIYVHSVGDSRCYRLRENVLEQLNEDQSEVWELYKMGAITKDEIRSHPRRNIITMAIGTNQKIDINSYKHRVRTNDLYLLCSDGLTDMASEDDIRKILYLNENLENRANKLIELANANGGKDNISVILILVDGRKS